MLLLILGMISALDAEFMYASPQSGGKSEIPAFAGCISEQESSAIVCVAILQGAVRSDKAARDQSVLFATRFSLKERLDGITYLHGNIVSRQNGQSAENRKSLAFRFDKMTLGDGKEFNVKADVLAVIAPKNIVDQSWNYPLIVADKYPRDPETDIRLPGETKVEYLPPRRNQDTDLLRLASFFSDPCVRDQRQSHSKISPPCTGVMETNGVIGYKNAFIELEPGADGKEIISQIRTSQKTLKLEAGTVFLIRVHGLPETQKKLDEATAPIAVQ